MTEDYIGKLQKLKYIMKFPMFYFISFTILFIYSILELINRQHRPIDFIAMICHTTSGFFITFLTLSSEKVRKLIKLYMKSNSGQYDFMREDIERLSSATREFTHDLND